MLVAVAACAQGQTERILHFDSRIEIRTNGSLLVTETIQVQAGGNQIKRGIYRDFPQLYRAQWGLNLKTGFEVVEVRRDGKPEPFHTKNLANGVRVYMGSPSFQLPAGQYTYRLTYRTDRQLGFFADHDELYWNATGNGWAFPIDKVTIDISLPPGAGVRKLEAYTGPQGARGRDFTAQNLGGHARFESTRRLNPGAGITVVVTWPKGFLAQPRLASQWLRLAADNKGVVLALVGLLLVLIYYMAVWIAVGRDPKPGTIIPLYGPPAHFSPAAVRYLARMRFDDRCFAAALLNLAVKGAISVKQTAKKEYTLIRTHANKGELLGEEKSLLASFPADGELVLKSSRHQDVKGARQALKDSITRTIDQVYFVRNWHYWLPGLLFSLVPLGVSLLDARELFGALFMLVWLSFWTVAVTVLVSQAVSRWRSRSWSQAVALSIFALPFVAGEVFGLRFLLQTTSSWVAGLFAAGIIMNGVFYHLLKAPTLGGRQILDRIEGFKMYLAVAEQDRLNLENPPERTPELFERFLPYALALGVEQKWSEQFAEVLAAAARERAAYSPAWYSGPSWASLGATGFASSLGDSLSGAIASASTAPGSGSGGTGGGGSSGGGGGGGGGGGW